MCKAQNYESRFTSYANDDKENRYATFAFDDEPTSALALAPLVSHEDLIKRGYYLARDALKPYFS
ncbi:MAG TPA: hypothetical protein VFC02_17220 [Anaerolineales bacterium]|nr:hypothetical protein [Anaerolineales bacterium]